MTVGTTSKAPRSLTACSFLPPGGRSLAWGGPARRLVAFSFKGRGVWQRDTGALNAALRIFLRAVQQSLQSHCPGAAQCDPASLHLDAVAFIHRFGSNLNTHVHFHVCVVDGVFEALSEGVAFHAATGLDEAAISQVQANVRKRILRAFVACGHIAACDAKDINERAASSSHGGGFSVDAAYRSTRSRRAVAPAALLCPTTVCHGSAQAARRLSCFYRCGKGHTEPLQSDKYSGELVLTPLELINRIAQLVPPPRTHRHRYYGVLAPNSPLRAAVRQQAQDASVVTPGVGSPVTGDLNADADAGTTGAVVRVAVNLVTSIEGTELW